MKIVITDSGLGGLSLCALYAQYLKNSNCTGDFEITYINAAPSDDRGYNQMDTREEKIQTFDSVLQGIKYFYKPDYIFVACNTLSALIDDIPFAQNEFIPIDGIIKTGISLIINEMRPNPQSGVFVFATDTTIEEKVYSQELIHSNIPSNRIVECALTGVATMISNDSEGHSVYKEIKKFVHKALVKMPNPFKPLYVFLGCTHYGYRELFFTKAFSELGYQEVIVLNPNNQASRNMISKTKSLQRGSLNLSIEFVSQYALPKNEITTLSQFLKPYSHETVQALQNYTLKSDLLYQPSI